MSNSLRTGIASIGVQLPSLALPVEELARVRGIDPNKFTLGLGCREIALCAPECDVVTLAVGAARRALARWDGDVSRIGLIVVGTETAKDMSRPLSAFVAEELGLSGAIRSYEVKHACYGGTLALRQALEWRWSGASRGKAALVIAADIALYALEDGGEPTQGAGAVAFVVDEPRIASVDVDSFAYAEPAFDFWRPVGQLFPSVEGQLSLDCYKKAAADCFTQLVGGRDAKTVLAEYHSASFHVPFPKMVVKAALAMGESFGWSEDEAKAFFAAKIEPTMTWNRRVGNCYTASVWLSVAHALGGRRAGEKLLAFSYGSGYGAELLSLTAGELAEKADWAADVDADLASRTLITGERYLELRAAHVGVK